MSPSPSRLKLKFNLVLWIRILQASNPHSTRSNLGNFNLKSLAWARASMLQDSTHLQWLSVEGRVVQVFKRSRQISRPPQLVWELYNQHPPPSSCRPLRLNKHNWRWDPILWTWMWGLSDLQRCVALHLSVNNSPHSTSSSINCSKLLMSRSRRLCKKTPEWNWRTL
jgi:hypothetical protein